MSFFDPITVRAILSWKYEEEDEELFASVVRRAVGTKMREVRGDYLAALQNLAPTVMETNPGLNQHRILMRDGIIIEEFADDIRRIFADS